MPKILTLDIETRPILAYVWGLFKQNIGLNQIKESGGTLCVGAKWLGEKDTMFFSVWKDGEEGMARAIHGLIEEADAIITYNGDKFDLPKLNGNFIMAGLAPPPPPTSIDILKTVRKLGLTSNKLAYVGPFLKVGRKIETEGFDLWTQVMNGDEAAQKRMEKYCRQDVVLTEQVYQRILPFIRNHPHLGLDNVPREACGACGSTRVQKRGFRRTKYFRIQRLQCQACGSWADGQRKRITTTDEV